MRMLLKIENARLVGRAGKGLTALNFLADKEHFAPGWGESWSWLVFFSPSAALLGGEK